MFLHLLTMEEYVTEAADWLESLLPLSQSDISNIEAIV